MAEQVMAVLCSRQARQLVAEALTEWRLLSGTKRLCRLRRHAVVAETLLTSSLEGGLLRDVFAAWRLLMQLAIENEAHERCRRPTDVYRSYFNHHHQ